MENATPQEERPMNRRVVTKKALAWLTGIGTVSYVSCPICKWAVNGAIWDGNQVGLFYLTEAERGKVRDTLHAADYAKIRVLDRVPDDDSLLRINVSQNTIRMESLINFEARKDLDRQRERARLNPPSFKEDKDKKYTSWSGSGFAIRHGRDSLFLTSEHVLKHFEPALSMGASMDKDKDVAAIPMRRGNMRDPFSYSRIHSHLTDRALNGREVSLVGFGGDLFKISGQAIAWPVRNGNKMYAPETVPMGKFALKLRPQDLPNRAMMKGTSGSKVIDRESGDTVGIGRAAPMVYEDWEFSPDQSFHLIVFSGIDAIRGNLKGIGNLDLA